MENFNNFMDELYESPDFQTWLEECNAENIAHMEAEAEEIDTEEYAAFFLGMAELVAMNTANIADRGQAGLNP